MKTIDDEVKDLVDEIGDSLPMFLKVLYREMSEINFKGIEFVKLCVSFHIDNMSLNKTLVTVEIWNTAVKIDEEICSRFFHYNGEKRQLENIFWLIIHWKNHLISQHQNKLKSKTLFD